MDKKPVIPAKARIHFGAVPRFREQWIPAFAGMTEKNLNIEYYKSDENTISFHPRAEKASQEEDVSQKNAFLM
ncbi:Uncharacterized protein dnm_074900 [Desulfonema magnum]|uniref:Uncharacterized protein n=1 Tax=Desulfonema magnum TaxID=45655 RepID=A0A975GST9_9BACT|nr:Uncharacterized protein dnm_074900 [Desulfonema magnum]